MRLLLLAFAISAVGLQAQDPGMLASQQASQAGLDALSANQALPAPTFSHKSGTYPGSFLLSIKSSRWLHHTRIFYTIGNWTPTTRSTLYTGPILIDRTQTVSAIAFSGSTPTLIRRALYTLPVTSAAPAADAGSFILPAGTQVSLAFAAGFDSSSAVVGQAVPLVLAEDLILHGQLVVPHGVAAQGTVTEVKRARSFERPGSIAFRTDTLQVNGQTIHLIGSEEIDGPNLGLKRNLGMLVPVVGAVTLLQRGADAEIPAGAELRATLATSMTLISPTR